MKLLAIQENNAKEQLLTKKSGLLDIVDALEVIAENLSIPEVVALESALSRSVHACYLDPMYSVLYKRCFPLHERAHGISAKQAFITQILCEIKQKARVDLGPATLLRALLKVVGPEERGSFWRKNRFSVQEKRFLKAIRYACYPHVEKLPRDIEEKRAILCMTGIFFLITKDKVSLEKLFQMHQGIFKVAAIFYARYGHFEKLQQVLTAPLLFAWLNDFLLEAAVDSGELKVVQFVHEKVGEEIDSEGYGTALYKATQGGYEPIVRFLLTLAFPDERAIQEDKKNLCFQVAARAGSLALIKCILQYHRLDVISMYYKERALKDAAKNGHKEVVNYLLLKNIHVSVEERGRVLEQAAIGGHLEVIKSLCTHFGPEGIPTVYKEKSLKSAAKHGHEVVVEFLLWADRSLADPRQTCQARVNMCGMM